MTMKQEIARSGDLISVATVGALLAAAASFWLGQVNSVVTEPYLDEEFHVRQAQVYCKGDFETWDPKITTPPGLYLISWAIYRLRGRCSIIDLRALNVVTVILGYLLTYDILRWQRRSQTSPSNGLLLALTAANTWLFPPLFFFSGLYYTDVQSAIWVLLSYRSYLQYEASIFSWRNGLLQVLVGIIALFFRQTNIFWVAIFPAGLSLITSAAQQSSRTPGAFGGVRKSDPITVVTDSWKKMRFYDLPVYDAGMEDYLLAALSLAIVTVANLKKSVLVLLPYISVIFCFAAFVIWNGGVVLGDKSNHVATLHLPQMLYLWPYMLFFSWPLVLHSLLTGNMRIDLSIGTLTRTIFILGTLTNLAMVVIHYNTIVHPFTLADNRHYVFYVFRILMRKDEIKYVAAPVYILSGYAVLQTLGARPAAVVVNKKGKAVGPPPSTGCSTSFVLIWVITTALSLVTAPLVEPRYCIIPWMMWRLRIPLTSLEESTGEAKAAKSSGGLFTLLVEALWFVAIAIGTGYMFLYKGFPWPQEPGKIQRFMW